MPKLPLHSEALRALPPLPAKDSTHPLVHLRLQARRVGFAARSGRSETLRAALFPETPEGHVAQASCSWALQWHVWRAEQGSCPRLNAAWRRQRADSLHACLVPIPRPPALPSPFLLSQVRWYSLQFLVEELVDEMAELHQALCAVLARLPG